MFNWILNIFAGAAYSTAIESAGLASMNGLYQMKEPANLQELASKKN